MRSNGANPASGKAGPNDGLRVFVKDRPRIDQSL
jgi:hypothetical protein